MNIKTLITIISVWSVVLSCNKDDSADNAFNYLEVEYYEHFSSSGREIFLNLKTLETFPCSNFQLEVNQNRSNNHLDIKVSDIQVPDVCITALGPATQTLSLGQTSFAPSKLTLWVNENQHDVSINIDKNTISVLPGNTFKDHLFFAFDSLMRIPDNTVWGFAAFEIQTNEKSQNVWSEINEAFAEAGAKDFTLEDGFYYYFLVKDSIIHFENIKQNLHTFYFLFEEDLDVLVDIYERIMENHNSSSMQLRLFDTKGERRHVL